MQRVVFWVSTFSEKIRGENFMIATDVPIRRKAIPSRLSSV